MTDRRPTQVSVASGLVIAGSVVAVLMAFSEVSGVHSLKTREAIESYLSKPPGDSFGVSVHEAQLFLVAAAVTTAVCAAATAVLGGYVMQRSRGSRLGLTVLAVPLVLAGLLSGGFATAVVAAATVMLWLEPSRSWVEGRAAPSRTVVQAPLPPPVPPPTQAPVTRDLSALPPPTAAPVYPTAPMYRNAPTVTARPSAVVWACLVTWAFASFAVLVFGQALVKMATDTHSMLDQMHQQNPHLAAQGISDTMLTVALYVTCGVVMTWSLVAATLALLAWRRVRWAATGLLVSTVLLGGLGLLMLRSDVRRWYAVRP